QQPAIGELSLKDMGERRYVIVDGRRAAAYVRVPGRVRFFLDEAVYADAAKTLLPEIEGYTAGLLDHLLRASLRVQVSGKTATVTLEGAGNLPAAAKVRVFGDDVVGNRKELSTLTLTP